jgi:hypothetical protein
MNHAQVTSQVAAVEQALAKVRAAALECQTMISRYRSPDDRIQELLQANNRLLADKRHWKAVAEAALDKVNELQAEIEILSVEDPHECCNRCGDSHPVNVLEAGDCPQCVDLDEEEE